MRRHVTHVRQFLRRNFYAVSFAVLLVGISAAGAVLLSDAAEQAPEIYAREIVAQCVSEPHRPTCYDKAIPGYFSELSFDAMFEVIRAVQARDPVYGYCHLVAHSVGELEVQKDPSKWMDVMVRCPQDGMCANGCMHGALITRFTGAEAGMTETQIEEALPDISIACEPRAGWNPSQLDKGNCYHGLGHLSMFLTFGDMHRSLAICDRLGKKKNGPDMSELCYGGVFMQLFQPLGPDDEAMVAHIDVSKDNFVEFCNSFPKDGGRRSCFARGSMLFEDTMKSGEGIRAFCELSEDPEIESMCYAMVFALVGSSNDYDLERIDGICRTVVPEQQGECYGMAAINMIDADPALIPRMGKLCAMAPAGMASDTCHTKVAEYAPYRFNKGSVEFGTLCDALPDPWDRQCLGAR